MSGLEAKNKKSVASPSAAFIRSPSRRHHRRSKFKRPPQTRADRFRTYHDTFSMGNFLTSPITEKETRTGSGNGLFYGLSAMQGWRTSMEDSHIAQVKPAGLPEGVSIFAVCDGHGGRLAALAAEELMVQYIAETFEKRGFFKSRDPTPAEIGDALTEAFLALDAKIRTYPEVQMGSDQSGCTAIAAYVTKEYIIVANSGVCFM